ncbi:MAG: DUF1573 domain-containing protein [Deltaproteobacteria bacterium]|nr:DUF1573 domain-containing protein [Deltaproteobacteria bacterium]
MNKIVLILFLVFFFSSQVLAQTTASPAPGPGSDNISQAPGTSPQNRTSDQMLLPRMIISETEFDARLNPPGSSVSHNFVVRNEGTDDLKLEVVPGCGCTVTSFDGVIAPGAAGSILVTVDLYEAWAGHKVNKAVTVTSNDPENPLIRLIMHAQVDVKK